MDVTTRERLYEEHKQLCDRIVKLQSFIYDSPAFLELPDIDRSDLIAQLSYMQHYSYVLSRRVGRLANA